MRKEEALKRLDDERRPTFKRYVEMLLEEMAVTNAPGTLENYDYVLRRTGPVFNDYKMEDITPAMIKKYIVDFQANGKNHFTGELVGHKTVLKPNTSDSLSIIRSTAQSSNTYKTIGILSASVCLSSIVFLQQIFLSSILLRKNADVE